MYSLLENPISHFQRRTPDGHGNEEDWGSFQLHRRPHGLIILAECSTAIDVALLHEVYQTKKQRSTTIFDSRCFVFGIDNGGSTCRLSILILNLCFATIKAYIKVTKVLHF